MNPTLKAHLISGALTVVSTFLAILAVQISHLSPTPLDLATFLVVIRATLKLTVESFLTPSKAPLSV